TEHYGQPSRGLHSLQVEVNRCLYMDEQSLQKTGGYDRVRADIARLVAELARAFAGGLLLAGREAAE
ncbi:MAG: N-formylglutamate amidohydrolase, partial [Bauldia sp.]|nr:N-formylglutamate amidohydrolase [Bauldia sp.]